MSIRYDDEPAPTYLLGGLPVDPRGYSSAAVTFDGVRVEFALDRIRLLAASLRRDKGGFSTDQARAFLLLYGEELQDAIDKTVREFLKEKVG